MLLEALDRLAKGPWLGPWDSHWAGGKGRKAVQSLDGKILDYCSPLGAFWTFGSPTLGQLEGGNFPKGGVLTWGGWKAVFRIEAFKNLPGVLGYIWRVGNTGNLGFPGFGAPIWERPGGLGPFIWGKPGGLCGGEFPRKRFGGDNTGGFITFFSFHQWVH